MSQKIIDYTLDSLAPSNPDGSFPETVVGCNVVAGPGLTILGTYPQALDFAGSGRLKASIPLSNLNTKKFCARLVFKIDNPVISRQILIDSNGLPFSLYLLPGTGTSDFDVVSTVTTDFYGPGKASTQFFIDLHLGTWYELGLAYDTDTLAVYVNGIIYSVHAFPDGTISLGPTEELVCGTSSDGTSPFKGAMAALQLHDDIPIELETQLDERRSHPQWYLTYKQEDIKSILAFGEPSGEFYLDLPSESWIQEFPRGIVMYHDSNGQAFEMHGAILQAFWGLPNRIQIGYLISDEINGAQSGSRKSLFSRGGIYWSPNTGAFPVMGQILGDYEGMGEAAAIGLPVGPRSPLVAELDRSSRGRTCT